MANTLKFGNGEWYGSEGNILAYNDENGNFKPLPFSFSRGSSATRVNQQGLIETVGANDARVDYKDNANGALLLEPSRSNLITYSEDFSQWSKTGTTSVSSNDNISPDGTQNASTVSGLTGSGSNDLYLITGQNPASKTYFFSVYLKGEGILRLQMSNNVNQGIGENVTLTSDWKRHIVTGTFNSTSGTLSVTLDDSGATASEYKVWGAQIEAGSYATSYIPTQGTAQTRLADNTTTQDNVPTTIIGQTSGVLYCNFKINNNPTSTRRVVIMSDGTGNERIGISLGSNIIYGFIVNGGSTQCEIVKSSITSGNYKCAFSYNNNDFVFYVNGSQVGTDTSGTVATCDRIDVGNQFGTSVLEGSINDIKLYNTRLSNSELAALTQV